MKDVRGTSVSAVRSAILKKFGLQLTSKGRKNLRDILEWKNSKEVGDGHATLFTDDGALDDLTKSAFPSMDDEVSDERYTDHYIYTAAVADIILNPNHPALEVNKKPLKLRLQKFRVFIEFIYN